MKERRDCPICLEKCNIESVKLPCRHQIHSQCLELYMKNNILKCAECSIKYKLSKDRKIIIKASDYKNMEFFIKNKYDKISCILIVPGMVFWLIVSTFYFMSWTLTKTQDSNILLILFICWTLFYLSLNATFIIFFKYLEKRYYSVLKKYCMSFFKKTYIILENLPNNDIENQI